MDARRVLLVGDAGFLWQLPPVLARAGFTIDAVTLPTPYLKRGRSLRRVESRSDHVSVLRTAAAWDREAPYDWIVVGDDWSLRLLTCPDVMPVVDRARIAPVVSADFLSHLGSKVELSRWLESAGVRTPRFGVAVNVDEAREVAGGLGYPVMLKADHCSGGAGVRRVEGPVELETAWSEVFGPGLHEPPAVLQTVVRGQLCDLSSVFRGGVPVSVTVSQTLEEAWSGGPARLRRFLPETQWGEAHSDLERIGKILGLDGFANISAIRNASGEFEYFEVDARPTMWFGGCRQLGDQVARDLSAFHRGLPAGPAWSGRAPLFRRLSKGQLLRNRDGVWATIPWGNPDAFLSTLGSSLRRSAQRRRLWVR